MYVLVRRNLLNVSEYACRDLYQWRSKRARVKWAESGRKWESLMIFQGLPDSLAEPLAREITGVRVLP